MISHLKGLGAGGLLGALLGIALVIWIEPTTPGGAGLIIVVAILLTLLLFEVARSVASVLRSKPREASGRGMGGAVRRDGGT